MGFTFKPAIYKNATLYELPRPVLRVRLQDAWDFEQFKVPLRDGDFLAGHSRQGIDILVEGQFGTQAGVLKKSEAEMFEALEALRNVLSVAADEEKYAFFLYHDSGTATYRHFKACSTVRFESDLSDQALFDYSIVIHAEDPVIYPTGPD